MLSRMPVSVVTPSVATASVAKIGNVPAEKRPGMTIRGILVNELRGSVVTPNVVMLNEMKPLVRTIRVTGNGSSHHVILTNEQMSQFSGTLHSVVTPSGTSLNGTRLNEKVVGHPTKPLVIRKTGRENPGNAVMPSVVTPNGATIRLKIHNGREKIVNNGMSRAKLTNGTQLRVTSLNGRLPSVVTPNGAMLNVVTPSEQTSNENRNPYRSNGSKIENGVLNGKALHGKAAWQLRSTRIIPFLPQIKPGAKTG
ncbi:hypothetical protein GCM10028817_14730 [Spirosoma pomorum]